MKKFLLILFLFLSSNLFAQNFAPVGAKWYYSLPVNPPYIIDYIEAESVGDTIIDNKICSKIISTYYYLQIQWTDTWFMRSDSDKIFYYQCDSSRFLVLYDFTKQQGDSFVIEGYYKGGSAVPLIAYIDSVGTVNINGQNLKFFYAHTNDSLQYSDWSGTELFGNYRWMFPQGDFSFNYYGPLRCYNDSGFGLYETGVTPSCDWMTSVSEINSSNPSIEISPNPSSGIFNLQFQNSSLIKSIDVMNVLGKKIFSSNRISDSQFVLNFSTQPSGVYFLLLRTESGTENKIIVVNK